MGKLSLKKKNVAGGANQAKITGFFDKPRDNSSSATKPLSPPIRKSPRLASKTKSSENSEVQKEAAKKVSRTLNITTDVPDRVVLENMTNKESKSEPILVSPVISRKRPQEDKETFAKTPEQIPRKRKFRLKGRGPAGKDDEGGKRKLDLVGQTSPIVKRRKGLGGVDHHSSGQVEEDDEGDINADFSSHNMVTSTQIIPPSTTSHSIVTSTEIIPPSTTSHSIVTSTEKIPLNTTTSSSKTSNQVVSQQISRALNTEHASKLVVSDHTWPTVTSSTICKTVTTNSTCKTVSTNNSTCETVSTNNYTCGTVAKQQTLHLDSLTTSWPSKGTTTCKTVTMDPTCPAEPVTSPSLPVTPTKQEDDLDSFLACFTDSPFKLEEEQEQEQPLAANLARHKVVQVEQDRGCLLLSLEACYPPTELSTVVLRGSWANTLVRPGDTVHLDMVLGGEVTDQTGLVVVDPDTLVSSTAVVSALFCTRKAVLAEKYKGYGEGGGNRIMLVGTVVHELLQAVLKERSYKRNEILQLMDQILGSPRILSDLVSLGLTDGDMRREVEPFIGHIQYFVRRFLLGQQVARPEGEEQQKGGKKGVQERPQWRGVITKVQDIEENFWSPRLGVKGKIDLTVETQGLGGGVKLVQPLEIKTGKPSYSTSHCGQVILYCMMSGDRRDQSASGLLLYLRSSSMAEVPAGRNEQRGLIQLRNELVAWLKGAEQEKLPSPLSHEVACSKCDYLAICGLHQATEDKVPPAPHPMARLVPDVLAHLTQQHTDWFKRWSGLLDLEVGAQEGKGGQRTQDLWCLTPSEREARGQAVSGLVLEKVEEEGHCFVREEGREGGLHGLGVGEVVTVSTSTQLALAQGVVKVADGRRLVVWLERDLTGCGPKFVVDKYAYQGGQGGCYVGLARLMGDTPQAARLRQVIIEGTAPNFAKGLGREVATIGREVLRNLNKVQQKAVFKSLMCDRFTMIRGMPGSGKTTTIVGLVRLLAKLNQTVLVVAYTNSAVDTILTKLLATGQPFLRLGRRGRVRAELGDHTAEEVASKCQTADQLAAAYQGFKVVGTTCLGADHPATAGRTFDWCILDEASQAVLPSVISPLLLANRFILVGDPAQLPPTVQSKEARAGGLDQSLFTLLDTQHPEATLDLHLQYRMNERIAALANHLTYKGKLECGDQATSDRVLSLAVDQEEGWVSSCLSSTLANSVVWLDTRGGAREMLGTSGFTNQGEGSVICRIVSCLVAGGGKQEEVGVIAPYSAQVTMLREMVVRAGHQGVEVGTVDQFQGRDKEVVIYSCTRSNTGGEDARTGHILLDTRRLNVAVTRAKVKLIILGDRQTLVRDYPPFRRIETFFSEENFVQLSSEDIEDACKV